MIKILFAIIIVEAITEICVESNLLEGVRNKLKGFLPKLLADNIECGYCASFSIGIIVSYLLWVTLPFSGLPEFIQPLLSGVVIHRLSNVCHGLFKVVIGFGSICTEKVFAFLVTREEDVEEG